MAIIRIKRSTGVTAPSSLELGELAVTIQAGVAGSYGNSGGRLFVGNASGNPVEIGGEYYAGMLDHEPSVVTPNSAVIVGSLGTVNNWYVSGITTSEVTQFNSMNATSSRVSISTVTSHLYPANATISNALNVSGLSNLGAVNATNLTLTDFLSAAGVSTFLSSVSIGAGITVAGIATVTGNLSVGSSVIVGSSGTEAHISNDGDFYGRNIKATGLTTSTLVYVDNSYNLSAPTGLEYTVGVDTGVNNLLRVDGDVSAGTTVFAPVGVITSLSGSVLTYANASIESLTVGVGTSVYIFPLGIGDTGQILKSDGNGALTFVTQDSRLQFEGDSGTGSVGLGSEVFTISGTPYEVDTVAVGNTITIGLPAEVIIGTALTVSGPVSIAGSLTVQGNITYLDSTITQIQDKKIDIAYTDSPNDTTADGGGISIKGSTDKEIVWSNSVTAFTVNQSWYPLSDNTYDLGASGQQWRNLYVNGLADFDDINVSSAATVANLTVTEGSLDGVRIGIGSSAVGNFSVLGFGTALGGEIDSLSQRISGNLRVTGVTTLAQLFVTTNPAINAVAYATTTGEVGFTSAPSAGISTSTYILTSLGISSSNVPVWTDTIDCGTY